MGEHSKEVGEFGEKLARDFFTILGWKGGIWNRDVHCCRPQAHASKQKTHGLDALYLHRTPLFADRTTAVFVSVKCNDRKYPSGRSAKFKGYRNQLEQSIYCAMRDAELADEYPALNDVSDIVGVVVWLTTSGEGELLADLSSSRYKPGLFSKNSILVDNRRRSFLTHSITQASQWARMDNREVSFLYPSVDFNTTLVADKNQGTLLPVQMLHSNALYFVSTDSDNNKTVLVYIDETPELEGMVSYIGSVLHWTNSLQTHTRFCFRGLNIEAERAMIDAAKSRLRVSHEQVSVCAFLEG